VLGAMVKAGLRAPANDSNKVNDLQLVLGAVNFRRGSPRRGPRRTSPRAKGQRVPPRAIDPSRLPIRLMPRPNADPAAVLACRGVGEPETFFPDECDGSSSR
jgi:hypothetical protein